MPAPALAVLSGAVLVVLLAVAFRHPRRRVEAAAGVVGPGLLLGCGAVTWERAATEMGRLLPVVLFLVASLLVAEACAATGVFTYLGGVVARTGDHRPQRVLTLTVVAAAAVTAVLSLDATVVMLTPVVAQAAIGHRARRPLAAVCVRLANSASLLLPVSNLTNLLALPRVPLGFAGWTGVMAVPWLAVLAVEYAGIRLLYAADLSGPPLPDGHPAPASRPTFVLVVLALMLCGFAVASPLGVQPFWVAAAAFVALAWHGRRHGALSARQVLHAAHLSFAVFVLGLGVVVAAVAGSFLTAALSGLLRLLPGAPGAPASGLVALLAVAACATVVANVVNNLPATLVLVPLVAPLGTPAVLAALVGLNVGAGLTYPGSLANLLWRRVLTRSAEPPAFWLFHRTSLLVTPVAVVVGVLVLWAEAVTGVL